jgi:hypothetical protein
MMRGNFKGGISGLLVTRREKGKSVVLTKHTNL